MKTAIAPTLTLTLEGQMYGLEVMPPVEGVRRSYRLAKAGSKTAYTVVETAFGASQTCSCPGFGWKKKCKHLSGLRHLRLLSAR